MTTRTRVSLVTASLLLWGLTATVGCGGEATPAPPEIDALSLATYTLLLDDGDEAINGELAFYDPNGDVAELMIEVNLPDGTDEVVGPLPLEGADGLTRGTVTFSLTYSRDTLGRYDLTVWLLDSRGESSNELTGSIVSRM